MTLPAPIKGLKIVGYMPLTGQPKNADGTLKLAFEYERPTIKVAGKVVGEVVSVTLTNNLAKPNRRPRSPLAVEQGSLI